MECGINLFIRLISQLISTVIVELVEKSNEKLKDVYSLSFVYALDRVSYDFSLRVHCCQSVTGREWIPEEYKVPD